MSIENAAMSDELQRPKGDLTDEKIYLEDEILSEMNFEEIVGKSAALLFGTDYATVRRTLGFEPSVCHSTSFSRHSEANEAE
jgi:hypothetical protein